MALSPSCQYLGSALILNPVSHLGLSDCESGSKQTFNINVCWKLFKKSTSALKPGLLGSLVKLFAFRKCLRSDPFKCSIFLIKNNFLVALWSLVLNADPDRLSADRDSGMNWIRIRNTCLRGSQRDVVFLGWPIAPTYMSPMRGGGEGGGVAESQPMSTAVHMEPK